uniref:Uncharacterized protein n=1 Tax=uncultured marine virus TaxID=186617 RepID=A0A0F7L628_9VIRU|nr:hypothetical protein [uncultured marine virus]
MPCCGGRLRSFLYISFRCFVVSPFSSCNNNRFCWSGFIFIRIVFCNCILFNLKAVFYSE